MLLGVHDLMDLVDLGTLVWVDTEKNKFALLLVV
jgi:hypothetical protein